MLTSHPFSTCCHMVEAILFMLACQTSAMPCTSLTSFGESRVICRHHRLTRFPANVSNDVTVLDLSFNFLTSLHSLGQPEFRQMRYLDVRNNSLTSLPNNTFAGLAHLQTLLLSGNAMNMSSDAFKGLTSLTRLNLATTGLTSVPEDMLRNVKSLERLDLSHNLLTTVHNHSLLCLPNLQHLSLMFNKLTSLQSAAFAGLGKLMYLDLRFNHLSFERGYPQNVFRPLTSLEVLLLRGNVDAEDRDYPEHVFESLSKLKNLSIDTMPNVQFSTTFRNLSSLASLSLKFPRRSSTRFIHNDTFAAFHNSTLESLVILGYPLLVLEKCAFCHLPHLTSLTVAGTKFISIFNLFSTLYGLQNQTMELVDFSKNKHQNTVILDVSSTRYLSNTCIKRLDLSSCRLSGLSRTAFNFDGILFKCLTHLDVSSNVFSDAAQSTVFKMFSGMTSIQVLRIDNQRTFARTKKRLPHNPHKKMHSRSHFSVHFNSVPSLEYLNMSSGVQKMDALPTHVHFVHGDNLTVLDMSYCGARHCDFLLTGLPRIHTLDMSGNDCYYMGPQLVQNMTTLRRLRLADTFLQETFLLSNGTSMLKPVADLEELDLSFNGLYQLPRDLLQHQPRLQRLLLAGNKFQAIPLDLTTQTSLQELDLRDNMVRLLPASDRQILDQLAANHTFSLQLRGNLLSCACDARDMLHWLATTKVRLDGDNHNKGFDEDYDDNRRDFLCVTQNGSLSTTEAVMDAMKNKCNKSFCDEDVIQKQCNASCNEDVITTMQRQCNASDCNEGGTNSTRKPCNVSCVGAAMDAIRNQFNISFCDGVLMEAMQKQCPVKSSESTWRHSDGLAAFVATMMILLTVFILLPAMYVLYRKRKHVRLAWNNLRYRALSKRNNFDYDALVVSTSDDVLMAETVRKYIVQVDSSLRLGLPQEELLLGTSFYEGMTQCLVRSRKVLLLVTPSFLEDDLSGLTILLTLDHFGNSAPRHVLLLQVDHPGHVPQPSFSHAPLTKLLPRLADKSVLHVQRSVTNQSAHPVWCTLAHEIAKK